MALTTKQRAYLREATHRWNLKIGATGSGKSWLDYAAVIPRRLLALHGEGAAVLLGNTQGTLARNILDPMREIWGSDLVGAISSDNTVRLFGVRVHVLGADTRKHVARLQGMTIEYAYGDEVTTWHEDVWQMLKSRLRTPHSCFDGTANPADPHHWLKTFLESDADVYCQTSTIDDGVLPPAIVAQLKREYAGTVYYNRFILGQWCAAEGVIWRSYADAVAAHDTRFVWPADRPLPPGSAVRIGVDFGGTGSRHAFVAVAVLPNYAGVVALTSARIDATGTDADALARNFLTFAEAVFTRWGEIQTIYCDSAEQVLIASLRGAAARHRLSWLAGRICNARKAPIVDRIRLTTLLLHGGRLWLMPGAASLSDALATALWSGKRPGVDERLDDGTTDIDTLDAFEYTIERDFKRFARI